MGSGLEFRGKVYWTSRELIEHLLRRGAELGHARLGADHPVTSSLSAHRDAVVEGKIVAFDGALPVAEDRAELASVLDAAGQEGLQADLFDGAGAKWVRVELSRLTRDLRGGAPSSGSAPDAPKEPFPSRRLLVGYGAGSMILAVYLASAEADGELIGLVMTTGFAAFVRAFWLSWGLDPGEDAEV